MDHGGRSLQGWGDIFGGFAKHHKTEEGHTLKLPKSGGGDSIATYFAMRKSSMGKTTDGGLRPLLNNEFVFQTGMLDQVSPSTYIFKSVIYLWVSPRDILALLMA